MTDEQLCKEEHWCKWCGVRMHPTTRVEGFARLDEWQCPNALCRNTEPMYEDTTNYKELYEDEKAAHEQTKAKMSVLELRVKVLQGAAKWSKLAFDEMHSLFVEFECASQPDRT